MKFGFFGGTILLVLTLVFSYIAIQNNKIAKEITIKSFELDKQVAAAPAINTPTPAIVDENKSSANPNIAIVADANKTEAKAEVPERYNDKWQKFDEKFKDFDKKFENF